MLKKCFLVTDKNFLIPNSLCTNVKDIKTKGQLKFIVHQTVITLRREVGLGKGGTQGRVKSRSYNWDSYSRKFSFAGK